MDYPKDSLAANLDSVRERMAAACARAGRSEKDVTLVAVTKSVGPATADELIRLGVTDIAENRIQDAGAKFDRMTQAAAARRHMIGHLQRNKVRQALQLFDRIHSVDSLRLAEKIENVAADRGRVMPVFLQVNTSGETRKFGLEPEEARDCVAEIDARQHVAVEGLMTMAPFGAPDDVLHDVFAKLRELSFEIDRMQLPDTGMKHLSMGMTQDFEIAIEEGATMVRVGTALFN